MKPFRKPFLRAVLTGAILLFAGALAADTIQLKNGQALNGKIVGQTRTTVRINVGGEVRTVQKSDISRISYGPTAADAEQKRAEEARRQRLRQEQALSEENKRIMEEEWERLDAERKAIEEERRKLQQEWEMLREKGAVGGAAKPETPASRLRGAIFRSLIAPGWGQYYQGRTTTGYVYGGSALALAGIAAATEAHYQSAREDYELNANYFLLSSPAFLATTGLFTVNDVSVFYPSGLLISQNTSDARARMETRSQQANLARSALLLFWAWNVADVVLFRPSDNQALSLEAGQGGLGLRFDLRY